MTATEILLSVPVLVWAGAGEEKRERRRYKPEANLKGWLS
jgi:hypothetical protein